mmetsp:Transcript_34223/g.77334  ORF Transcript_34223/g.77334 Transcript_34223/m.77334 type:complete len:211 (+) Transcript_34223:622-1254(+)
MKASGLRLRSSWSAWCWFTMATRQCGLRRICPLVGSSCPKMSLTRVVFPLPFSPRNTTRDEASSENSAPLKSSAPEPLTPSLAGYPKPTPCSSTMEPDATCPSPAPEPSCLASGSCLSSLPPQPLRSLRGSSRSSFKAAASSSSSLASASSLASCFCFITMRLICPADPPYFTTRCGSANAASSAHSLARSSARCLYSAWSCFRRVAHTV